MSRAARLIGFMLILLFTNGCTNPTAPISVKTVTAQPTTPFLVQPSKTTQPPHLTEVGSIQSTTAMFSARAVHAATLLLDGDVLITGGFGNGNDGYSKTAELYNPADGKFSLTGNMTIRRCCHTATRLADGRVLIAGGFNGDYLAGAEIYDPSTGRFSPTGSLKVARMDHVAMLLDNGKVLLAGGVGNDWDFLASAELYDPSTGLFTRTGDMNVARESHTITKLTDGRVLITGGHRGRHAEIIIYSSAEIYDLASGSFSEAGDMLVRRHKHDAVLLADGRVLIAGGSDENDDRGAYTSAEIYDPASGEFSQAADMPSIRYKHIGTSLLLKNGNILIAGGARNAVIYNEMSNSFSTVPGDLGTNSLSRLFSTATLLMDGRVLITGGYGIDQDVSAQAWIYQP